MLKILSNSKLKSLFLLCILILLSSCSKHFTVQKRKYNKGFYFASNKGNKSNANTATEEKQRNIVEHETDMVYASVNSEIDFEKKPLITKTKKSVVAPPEKKHERVKLKDIFYKPMNIKTYSQKSELQYNFKAKKQSAKKASPPGGGDIGGFSTYLLIFFIAFVVLTIVAYSITPDPTSAVAMGLLGALVLVAIVLLIDALANNPQVFSTCFDSCIVNIIGAAIVGIFSALFSGC